MNKKSYLRGIIVGIVFGLVASIPWIFLEVSTGFMTTILAGAIAYAVNYGYEFGGGPYDDRIPLFVMITTIIIICFGSFVVIPLYEMHKYGWPINIDTLVFWYKIIDVKSVLFNLGLSIVFAVLGARNATSNIETSNWTVNRKKMNNVNEQINIIIDELYILNAIDENSAVSIDEMRTDIPDNILKRRIQIMKKRKIIKEINNKYYINENRMG